MKEIKNIVFMLVIFSAAIIVSCGDKDENVKPEGIDLTDEDEVLLYAKKTLGDDVKFAYAGSFNADTLLEIAAGTEIESKDVWGIKFYMLKNEDTTFNRGYETALLEGSFSESLTKKIKFPTYEYELLYYNSQEYFLGSGGGEIFSYIIDFEKQKTYYAHLFAETGEPVSLFLSGNIEDRNVRDFFISNFKRDYPTLKIVTEDVDLKY